MNILLSLFKPKRQLLHVIMKLVYMYDLATSNLACFPNTIGYPLVATIEEKAVHTICDIHAINHSEKTTPR